MLPAVNAKRRVFLYLILYYEILNAIKLPKKRMKKTLGMRMIKVLMKYRTTAIFFRAL